METIKKVKVPKDTVTMIKGGMMPTNRAPISDIIIMAKISKEETTNITETIRLMISLIPTTNRV